MDLLEDGDTGQSDEDGLRVVVVDLDPSTFKSLERWRVSAIADFLFFFDAINEMIELEMRKHERKRERRKYV